MISNADYKAKTLDEGVRLVVSNLRDLAGSLVMAIQNQIEHDKLMALCLGINDDIQQTFNRYENFKKNHKPSPFESAFLKEYISSNLYLGGSTTTDNNIESNTKIEISNNNNNNNNEKRDYTKDLNDIFN